MRLTPLGRAVLALFALALGACSRGGAREVVVYTSVDQVFSEPIFRAFESAVRHPRCAPCSTPRRRRAQAS